MKTKALSMMGLGLAVACLCLAPQSSAIKGGIPAKPGEEDPPPDPELVISYQRCVILPAVDQSFEASSINDWGVVAGSYLSTNEYPTYTAFRAAPETIGTTVTYPDGNAEILPIPENVDSAFAYSINNLGQVAGCDYVDWWNGIGQKAVLWLEDGTEIDLGVAPANEDSCSYILNDAGLVMVRNEETRQYSVIVPLDLDGVADTWFIDDDDNGINDLLCPLPEEDFGPPMAMNASGVVVFAYGAVLTPDFDVLDAGGNPWIGENATIVLLQPLLDGDSVNAYDINDLGQIVGCSEHPVGKWDSDSKAVIWDDIGNPVDLGSMSKFSERLVAHAINNTGQIIGKCVEKKGHVDFLFHDGTMYDIRELVVAGGDLWDTDLVDINDDGFILTEWGEVLVPVLQP